MAKISCYLEEIIINMHLVNYFI